MNRAPFSPLRYETLKNNYQFICIFNSFNCCFQAFKFLLKILKTLPSDKKEVFAKDGVETCFISIVPTVIALSIASTSDNIIFLEVLEELADALVKVDYAENIQWKKILEHIYSPEK